QQTDADGGVTSFSYTLLNPAIPALSPVLLTAVTDPLGNQTTFRFNPQGFLLDVTDAQGQTRVSRRDSGTNLVLSITGPGTCGVCGVPAAGDETYTYDGSGNVLMSTDALGAMTSYTYD